MPEVHAQTVDPIHAIPHPKKRAFLAAVAQVCNIVRAAAIAEIDRGSHYDWMANDPEYVKAFTVAWGRGVDALESEAVRRAYEGVTKPVFHGGKRALDFVLDADGNPVMDNGKPKAVPAVVREYDTTLLIFLLNGNRSKKYRQRVEHSGTDGAPIELNVSAKESLEARIAGIAARIGADGSTPQPE